MGEEVADQAVKPFIGGADCDKIPVRRICGEVHPRQVEGGLLLCPKGQAEFHLLFLPREEGGPGHKGCAGVADREP